MVYVFLAQGFEEIEALTVVYVLRRADIDVLTVSIYDDLKVKGKSNISVISDCLISEVNLNENDTIVLPGGMPGTTNLENSEYLVKLLDFAFEKNMRMAAICAAPMIFGKRGYLKDKEAICYPGFENYLVDAKIKDDKVVVSGNIITSKGAGTALDFAFKIVEVIKDINVSNKIKTSMIVN